ncbi:coagulation factor VII-like [Aplochiton taeniatus]
MWLHLLCLVLSVCCCHPASVFLERASAHALLIRPKRANSGWFEELKMGNLERECLEEKCSYEEAREVFEHTEATDEFWREYNVPDSCRSNPCLHNGSCASQRSTYTCLCLPGFSGRSCERELKSVPDSCLYENGGCEHFCEEEGGGRVCSCADDYFLGTDGQSCVTQETIACGMIPMLNGSKTSEDARSRIVGGTECPKGHCPYQVLLVYKDKGFCGGVIYKPSWILTAAHCMENINVQFLKVVAGEHDTEQNENTEQTIAVAEVVVHPAYVQQTADSDIALLRLERPVAVTAFAVPVCLPSRSLAERELWAVGLHTVSGWGRRSENGPTSRLLRRLRVPRIRTQECVAQSGVRLTANMFCAGFIEGRQDSCKGDSGGPLVTLYRKTVFLLGIVSWGKGCARPGNYGIYTRVSNYLEWVLRHTSGTNHSNATATPRNLTSV